LTDYIRLDQFPTLGADNILHLKKIGVVSIFEIIRHFHFEGLKIAVLTGSLVLIPKDAMNCLIEAAAALQMSETLFSFTPLEHDDSFVYVHIEGCNKKRITSLITKIFELGEIHVLVGTQSLLGEGWDAPFVNTLIMASTVSSYVLSNQIRGRAMRTDAKNPFKTANIWHLASIDLDRQHLKTQHSQKVKAGSIDVEDDIERLQKRFKGFEGIYFNNRPIIENGIKRLGDNFDHFSTEKIIHFNQRMLNAAKERSTLAYKWDIALQGHSSKPALKEQIQSNYEFPSKKTFFMTNTLAALFIFALYESLNVFGLVLKSFKGKGKINPGSLILFAAFISVIVFTLKSIKPLYLFLRNGSIERSLKNVAKAVINTLIEINIIKTQLNDIKLSAKKDSFGNISLNIDGLKNSEKMYVFDAIEELLKPVAKPRYILERKTTLIGRFSSVDYHSVPYLMAQKKVYVDVFLKFWCKFVGPASIHYVHSLAGRGILLKARTKSYASAFQPKTERLKIWE
jgi:hypothetical protein